MTFCGRTANEQPIISYGNQATLRLTTDASVVSSGFSLQYKTGK